MHNGYPHIISIAFAMVTLAGCDPKDAGINSKACAFEKGTPVALKGQADYVLGTDSGYSEERQRRASFSAFDIDRTEVTNAEFSMFVQETNYLTTAEKPQPGNNLPGGAVFTPPNKTHPNWWRFVEGANWRNPEGPQSNIEGRENEPVVQISLVDAQAYAAWRGRTLPSEAQWEYAARGDSDTTYVWGETRTPNGQEKANTWQGAFPIQNTLDDGYQLRSPVGCYDPNAFGLYDMIGNVWEWTLTEYEGTNVPNSYAIKGGSFLCAENYCARYRAPARQSQEADFSTNHIGFRTASKT